MLPASNGKPPGSMRPSLYHTGMLRRGIAPLRNQRLRQPRIGEPAVAHDGDSTAFDHPAFIARGPASRTAAPQTIGDAKWRSGEHVASRASRLILDYAFRTLDLKVVRLSLFADNAAARQLYDKLGFVLVGKPEAAQKDGRTRDTITMELRRPD